MAKPLDAVRVLIVEDDPDSGEILEMALEALGARVTLAGSGAAALQQLEAARPDVLLCDLSLPDGSGLDWLAKFRALPGVATVPAIALSGKVSARERAQSLAAGFETHLNKPAQLADISSAITALVAPLETRRAT